MRVSRIFYTTLYLVSMCCCNPDISPGRTTSMTLIFIFQLMLKHVSIRENPWNWQIIYDRAWSLCVQIKRRAVLVTRDFIIRRPGQLVSDTFYILLDNVFTHHWTLIDALLAKQCTKKHIAPSYDKSSDGWICEDEKGWDEDERIKICR